MNTNCSFLFNIYENDPKFIEFRQKFETAFPEKKGLIGDIIRAEDVAAKDTATDEDYANEVKLHDEFNSFFASKIAGDAQSYTDCITSFNSYLNYYINNPAPKKSIFNIFGTSSQTVQGEPYGIDNKGVTVRYNQALKQWVPCGYNTPEGRECDELGFIRHCDKIGFDKDNNYACTKVYDCLLSGNLNDLDKCLADLKKYGDGGNFFEKAKNEVKSLSPEMISDLLDKFGIGFADETAIGRNRRAMSYNDWYNKQSDEMKAVVDKNGPMTDYLKALIDQMNNIIKTDPGSATYTKISGTVTGIPAYEQRAALTGSSGIALQDYATATTKSITGLLEDYSKRRSYGSVTLSSYIGRQVGRGLDAFDPVLQIGGASWDEIFNNTMEELKANGIVLHQRTKDRIKEVIKSLKDTEVQTTDVSGKIGRFNDIFITYAPILDAQRKSLKGTETLKRFGLDQSDMNSLTESLAKLGRKGVELKGWLSSAINKAAALNV